MKKKMLPTVLPIFLVLLLIISSCQVMDKGAQFGIREVKITKTVSVFFIRAVTGILGNLDTLFLSPRKDLCEIIDNRSENKNAYMFNVNGEVVFYYRISGQSIEIFSKDNLISPTKEQFPIEVIAHVLSMQEFDDLRGKVSELGLTLVQIETDDKLKCGFWGSNS